MTNHFIPVGTVTSQRDKGASGRKRASLYVWQPNCPKENTRACAYLTLYLKKHESLLERSRSTMLCGSLHFSYMGSGFSYVRGSRYVLEWNTPRAATRRTRCRCKIRISRRIRNRTLCPKHSGFGNNRNVDGKESGKLPPALQPCYSGRASPLPSTAATHSPCGSCSGEM
jgi:hypothetical protein